MKKLGSFLLVNIALHSGACSSPNEEFCDTAIVCPENFTCDLNTKTCVAKPADAGRPDAIVDAGASTLDAMATACSIYCDLAIANCIGDNTLYSDVQTCAATCSTFPPGNPGDNMADSVECRIYHARVAAESGDPVVHCTHASPNGGGVCVSQ